MFRGEVDEMHRSSPADDADHAGRRLVRDTPIGLDKLILTLMNYNRADSGVFKLIRFDFISHFQRRLSWEGSNSCFGPANRFERLPHHPTLIAGIQSMAKVVGY